MRSIKNKITAVGLVLLLTIPLLFTIINLLQQKAIQINSRLQLSIKKNETITLNKEKVYWLKKGKEVLIDGHFFDVKAFKIEGDMVLLTGYFDQKEDQLVNQIRHIFKQKKDADSPLNQSAAQFLFFPIFSHAVAISAETSWHFKTTQYPFFIEALPISPGMCFIHPPQL